MSRAGHSRVASGLMEDARLTDLDVAWQEREQEAAALQIAGHDSMALALRAYALEARVKASICRHLSLPCLPRSCKTHDLAELIVYTGRSEELLDSANIALRQNWELLVLFSQRELNNVRYRPRAEWARADLETHHQALDHPVDGVLAWLSRRP